jgi:hypothetical protein
MKKSKIYFSIGVIALQLGACMIHIGLCVMLLGAWLLLFSYLEFEENYEDKKEE